MGEHTVMSREYKGSCSDLREASKNE
eukprot:COSAG06_NODE_45341_length_355_cov_1.394531_1_plen_25_part_10